MMDEGCQRDQIPPTRHSIWSRDGASGQAGFKDEMPLDAVNPQSYGEICVMRRDGSDVRCLTDNPFEEATPPWLATLASVKVTSAR